MPSWRRCPGPAGRPCSGGEQPGALPPPARPRQARGAGRTGRPAPRVFSHPSRYSEVSYLELDKFLEDVR